MLNIDSIQLCGSYALFSLRSSNSIQMKASRIQCVEFKRKQNLHEMQLNQKIVHVLLSVFFFPLQPLLWLRVCNQFLHVPWVCVHFFPIFGHYFFFNQFQLNYKSFFFSMHERPQNIQNRNQNKLFKSSAKMILIEFVEFYQYKSIAAFAFTIRNVVSLCGMHCDSV